MIVLKSTYKLTCELYEARIADLKDQITMLRAQILPDNTRIPLKTFEADAVLSGKQEVTDVKEEDANEADEIQAEAARIFAATY